jgi:hypothetical protein
MTSLALTSLASVKRLQDFVDQWRSGFIRSSIGPWQHGQICGNRTLIVQMLQ